MNSLKSRLYSSQLSPCSLLLVDGMKLHGIISLLHCCLCAYRTCYLRENEVALALFHWGF